MNEPASTSSAGGLPDYERLGVFYLGKNQQQQPFLLPSADLVTHGVCLGMTGSGKTGLCIGLLEEAAIDGIPVIAIDPKGDLTNLVLGFPTLSPQAMAPWVDADEARRRGQTVEAFAAEEARKLGDGLAQSYQPLERINRLYSTCEFQIFTPGSDSGVPLAVLRSLEAPPKAVRDSAEALRTRVEATVTAVLGLVGIDADPVQSREHVLLATLLSNAWVSGRNFDLAGLVAAVQAPPFQFIGVLDLESFYPKADRFRLVLNQLLASPAAAALSHGVAPDIDGLLHGPTGHPRISIISIAHLSDEQRKAVVTLLLGNLVSWMRAQSGTSSLRALLFMDEVAGYLPPVANPPTKPLFLTLFKQARAFGVGIVVATQNPADVDYKVLSNAGTWFVGRLSTARDRAKVLEGLATASIESTGDLDAAIAGLQPRQFLVARAKDRTAGPSLLTTRQTLCYLRGPLGLDQIATLKRGARNLDASTTAHSQRAVTTSVAATVPPVLPPRIRQLFVPPAGTAGPLAYHPAVLGVARVRHVDKKLGLDVTSVILLAATPTESAMGADFSRSYPVEVSPESLTTQGVPGATFLPVPSVAREPDRYASWQKSFVEHVLRAYSVPLLVADEAGAVSLPNEDERAFRIRLGAESREAREAALAKVREKYRARVERAEAKVQKAALAIEKERSQADEQRTKAVFDVGGSVLGALFGNKTLSAANVARAQRAARGVKKAQTSQADIGRAEAALRTAEEAREALFQEIRAAVETLSAAFDPATLPLRTVAVSPKKRDIELVDFGLGWLPTRYRAPNQQTDAWGRPVLDAGGYEAAWRTGTPVI
jgi:hypothetical protein